MTQEELNGALLRLLVRAMLKAGLCDKEIRAEAERLLDVAEPEGQV